MYQYIHDEFIPEVKAYIRKVIEDPSLKESADDLISLEVKRKVTSSPFFKEFSFFSEEDQDSFSHQNVFILDPIDGTKEFRLGIKECCLSFSILNTLSFCDEQNIHWIWNFFNEDESLYCDGKVTVNKSSFEVPRTDKKKVILISRNDYLRLNLKNVVSDDFILCPVGSIAYKLQLLAAKKCDAVISITNKNIWDICAGTMLLNRLGFKSSLKDFFNDQQLIRGPIYWYDDSFSLSQLTSITNDII